MASLAALIFASDKFIGSAEKVGYSMGVSPFVIGVTLVAFGTSLPELATSIISVNAGASEIVVGNVVGSNITNILLVLGLAALSVGTLRIERNIMRDDIPLVFGSSLLLYFVLQDNHFSLIEALIFLSGMFGFLAYGIKGQTEPKSEKVKTGLLTYAILIVSGIAVYFSADFVVTSIETLASGLGVNPSIVSLTLLALGTSLPEIVVSISAVRRGQHSLALGNVIGSNIFNTYAVMSIPSFFGELVIPETIVDFSLPFMLAVTVLLWIVAYSKEVTFWKAGMLLSFYIFFVAELIRLGFVS